MNKVKLQPTVAANEDGWWKQASTAPKQGEKILQTISFKLGSFDDKERTFKAIASSPCVDRQGDVIDQNGWDLSNFVNNPVIPWAHDYYQPPIARAVEIGVSDGVLQMKVQFPPAGVYDFADTIWNLYRNGFLFAFSVGFIPKATADGDYKWEGNTFTECELLEVSAVVVPANPQALALAAKQGVIDTAQAKQLVGRLKDATGNLEEVIKAQEMVAKTVNTSSLPLADKDVSWDKGAAIKRIVTWASDDNGDIDFSKYKKCFMFVDDNNDGDDDGGKKQGDYHLPFADIIDDEPKAVWNAVKAIMGVLNGARGGTDALTDDERAKVYAQVKKYYKKFGEEAPALSEKSLTDIKSKNNNEIMGMKDLGTASEAMVKLAETLLEHGKALSDHSETMKAHAELVTTVAQSLTDHAKAISDVKADDTAEEAVAADDEAKEEVAEGAEESSSTEADEAVENKAVEGEVNSEQETPVAEEASEAKDEAVEEKAADEVANEAAANPQAKEGSDSDQAASEGADPQAGHANGGHEAAEVVTDAPVAEEAKLFDPANLSDDDVAAILKAVNEKVKA